MEEQSDGFRMEISVAAHDGQYFPPKLLPAELIIESSWPYGHSTGSRGEVLEMMRSGEQYISTPAPMRPEAPEIMPPSALHSNSNKVGGSLTRLGGVLGLLIDDRQRVYGPADFADMPDFQAGMAELFDPKLAKARLMELEAERTRLLAQNRANQADLLTASPAERLAAKARLTELGVQIREAELKHDVMSRVAEMEASRLLQNVKLPPPKKPLFSADLLTSAAFAVGAKRTIRAEKAEAQIIARQSVTDLEAEIAQVQAENTANIAEIMHGSAVERRGARNKLLGLRLRLALAKGRLASLLDPVPADLQSHVPERSVGRDLPRIGQIMGALAVRSALS